MLHPLRLKRYLLSLLLLATIPACSSETAYVSVLPSAALRAGPHTESKVIASVPYSAKVELIERSNIRTGLLGRSGQWIEVEWENQSGWIFSELLSSTPEAPPQIVLSGLLVQKSILTQPLPADMAVMPNCAPQEKDFPGQIRAATIGTPPFEIRLYPGGKAVHQTSNFSGGEGRWSVQGSAIVAEGKIQIQDRHHFASTINEVRSQTCQNAPPEAYSACIGSALDGYLTEQYGEADMEFQFLYIFRMHNGTVFQYTLRGNADPKPGKRIFGFSKQNYTAVCFYAHY